MSDQPTNEINLALGGGGARGFVHIGVLKEFAARQIPIKAIVGTSMGALIGALFAYRVHRYEGKEELSQREAADAVANICLSQNFLRLGDLNYRSLLNRGFLKGETLEDWLETQLLNEEASGSLTFKDLDFDLTITATDAFTGNNLSLNKHETPTLEIHRAVRASVSIPYLFRDVRLDCGGGRVYRCWDGGTTGNCRFDIAHRLNPSRHTFASTLTYAGEVVNVEEGILNVISRPKKIADRTIAFLMRQIEEVIIDNLDNSENSKIHLIRPRTEDVGTVDFGLSREARQKLIENGQQETAMELEKFEAQQA